jgi:hypothetical protein
LECSNLTLQAYKEAERAIKSKENKIMIEYMPAALSSLSTASNIISGLIKLRDFSKHAAELTELQSHIIQANGHIISEQQAHSALTAKIEELEKEVVRLKNWDAERQKYSRREIATGVFAYVENDFVGKLQNAHKFCCNCFDNYKKSTLQHFHIDVGRKIGLSCHNRCPDLVFHSYKDNTEPPRSTSNDLVRG